MRGSGELPGQEVHRVVGHGRRKCRPIDSWEWRTNLITKRAHSEVLFIEYRSDILLNTQGRNSSQNLSAHRPCRIHLCIVPLERRRRVAKGNVHVVSMVTGMQKRLECQGRQSRRRRSFLVVVVHATRRL